MDEIEPASEKGCGWRCRFCGWTCNTAEEYEKSGGGETPHESYCDELYEHLDDMDREIFEDTLHSGE